MTNFRDKYITPPLVTTGIYLFKYLMKALLATCKIEIQGIDHLISSASNRNCILMVWHNRLIILPEFLTKNGPQLIFRAVISKSKDGEILSRLIESYATARTLRVPHNARYQALAEMISQLKQGGEVIVITPDGPRGPRYKVKPGIAIAAKKTDALIIPLSWSASSFWQFKSWDKLIVPKPFSRICVFFGKPIALPKELDASQES